ncbi:MAG: DUF3857 domain-containing protein [Bacteroidales bacterium]|nr:DUF3857 domain-containing protein [Bacteroidales bacterium]
MKHLRYLLIGILFVCSASTLWAQKNYKFGKPTDEEWAMTQCEQYPEAEAVVLHKSISATFKLTNAFTFTSNANMEMSVSNLDRSGNNEIDFPGTEVHYEVCMRTKILKENGNANLDICYYSTAGKHKAGEAQFDGIAYLKVNVLSKNEKGKVEKRVFKQNTFEVEQLDEYYKVMHIIVPDAKVGDIIECQYQITSYRPSFLYDWTFQEPLPVLYAKCDYDIPAMIQYNVNVPINEAISKHVEQGVVRIESNCGDMKAPESFPTNHYIIEAKNLAPATQAIKLVALCNNARMSRPAPMPKGWSHLAVSVK